jgi:hypothetical protein
VQCGRLTMQFDAALMTSHTTEGRYTEWVQWDKVAELPIWNTSSPAAAPNGGPELYNHTGTVLFPL